MVEKEAMPDVTTQPTYKILFTSYNPHYAQTDSSPCIGASGQDQCKLTKNGVRIIALSQELVGRTGSKPFRYGDKVWLKGETEDVRCNGEFIVLDTMNKRYRLRGDLFFLQKKDNIGCTAIIHKI